MTLYGLLNMKVFKSRYLILKLCGFHNEVSMNNFVVLNYCKEDFKFIGIIEYAWVLREAISQI